MKKKIFVLLTTILMFTIAFTVSAEENEISSEDFSTGLEIMSAEELEAFHNTLPKIVDIKPNRIALSRFSDEESVLFENVEIAEFGEEKVYATSNDIDILSLEETEFLLTEAVDVSESLTFPPVGDQDQILACIPWAMCYYQLTNNHCVVNGLHSKTETGDAIPENIMAPGFIYSLCNGGVNASTHIDDVTEALVGYGCPNADLYNLQITGESLKKWCTDTNVWYDAMYNKPKKITYIPINTEQISNKNSNCVELIKRELANGYVLTFGTRAKDFELTTNITSNLDDTGIIEYGCKFRNNSFASDGHFMTIVGYDDTFWIYVNDNGQEDEGEFGAFKIMNSAGQRVTEYMTGYIWMAYDALGATSGVVNAPTNRYPAMENAVYCIEAQKNYIPLLVAEVEITTENREYILVTFNVSYDNNYELEYLLPISTNETMPTVFYSWKDELDVDSKIINFSGTTGEETIVVPFDLTRIISCEIGTVIPKKLLRVYVYVGDGNRDDNFPVSYGSIKIIEPLTGKTVEYSGDKQPHPHYEDIVKCIDFETTPLVGYSKSQDITIRFNSNVCSESIKENVYLVTPEGNLIYPTCEITDNKIIISAPNGGYNFNAKYELIITGDVMSVGGNHLDKQNKILIYINSAE